MKHFPRGQLVALAVLSLTLLVAASYPPPAEQNSTYDEWEESFQVGAAATVTQTWPKQVRKGNPVITLQTDVDPAGTSGLDSVTITVYTSQFKDPQADQWVVDTSYGQRADDTPKTVTLKRAKNIKFTVVSIDSLSNQVNSSLWVN